MYKAVWGLYKQWEDDDPSEYLAQPVEPPHDEHKCIACRDYYALNGPWGEWSKNGSYWERRARNNPEDDDIPAPGGEWGITRRQIMDEYPNRTKALLLHHGNVARARNQEQRLRLQADREKQRQEKAEREKQSP